MITAFLHQENINLSKSFRLCKKNKIMGTTTIPAEFVKIESINDIATISGLQPGSFLFRKKDDPNTLYQMDAELFYQVLNNFARPIAPSDSGPFTADRWYKPTVSSSDPGTTYSNAGNLTAKSGFDTLFWYNGTTWTKTEVQLPQATQYIASFIGSTFPLVSSTANPVQRTHNNAIWSLPAGQTAQSTDIPGVSSVWVKFNDIKTSSIPAGKNKFNKNDYIPKTYISTTTWLLTTTTNDNFKTTKPIRAEGSVVSVSGLPSIHNAAGYLWLAADGVSEVAHGYINANTTSASINRPTGAEYFQTTVNTAKAGENYNPDTIQIEFSSAPTAYEAYIPLITQINDYNLTVEKVTTDPLKSQSPISVAYFNGNALKKAGLTLEPGGKNLFNIDEVKPGQYVQSGTTNIIEVPGSTTLKTSGLIKVNPSGPVSISGLPAIHNALGYIWYAADGVSKVGFGSTQANVTNASFAAPLNGEYMRITVNSGKSGEIYNPNTIQIELAPIPTEYEPFTYVISKIEGYGLKPDGDLEIKLSTEGKVFFLFGDSITATAGADGSPISGGNWPSYAFPIMKASYTNFALSGAHIEDFTTSFPRQKFSQQIADAIATGVQPDGVIVSIGINSLNVADNDYVTTMGRDLTALDITKVMDALRINLRKIYEIYPNAVLFFGTPMKAIKSGAADEELTQRKIINQFKLMAQTFNFKIIDAFEEVGIVRDFEVKDAPGRYLTDGLHPNADGKEKQGKYYANQIIIQYPG